ncbi:EAL domain-containing protein [Pseudomonas sp. BP8]|uniref:putative bifunctional diguanylate cyclase/phosphodiesterase n=1 Tax=Pseudomonas sp. BP8 TaxID=2817864 RepID=UPI001AE5C10F|nr:EAL domain-containing protein (putative c-di-GMP-specific phosphodiesterase class I) [Pseudomonas sp. BP8]HDS1733524.1 EAL domain-containing protein [Pseudomonas putida]
MKSVLSQPSKRWVTKKFPDSLQWPRTQLLLRFSGLACIVHGLAWGAYYATNAMSLLTALLFAVVLVGVACLYLSVRQKQFSLGALAHLLMLITITASLADAPTAAGPRSAHLFFIPLGVASLLLFRYSNLYLRWLFPTTCFLSVAFFANSIIGFTEITLFPQEISALGHILNSAMAMALTIGVLAIFRDDLKSKVELHTALARAVARNELCTYMQPQVSVEGRIIGAEVLLRWNRPGYGMQSPAEFIPVAEETGLIHDMGLRVLEESCRLLKYWSGLEGASQWKLSVNVSPLQLTSPTFVEEVRKILEASDTPANRLCLEITESVFSGDLKSIVSTMEALRQQGVLWSLDDFGTGFSSLSLLRELPLDELKIDRSFIHGIEHDNRKKQLIRKIIEIAEILDISTTAEGIETQQQYKCLEAMGCHAFQGFFFGRPIAAAEFMDTYAASHKASRHPTKP